MANDSEEFARVRSQAGQVAKQGLELGKQGFMGVKNFLGNVVASLDEGGSGASRRPGGRGGGRGGGGGNPAYATQPGGSNGGYGSHAPAGEFSGFGGAQSHSSGGGSANSSGRGLDAGSWDDWGEAAAPQRKPSGAPQRSSGSPRHAGKAPSRAADTWDGWDEGDNGKW